MKETNTQQMSKAVTKELCPSRKFRTSKQKQRQREIILEIGKLIDMHCRACPKGVSIGKKNVLDVSRSKKYKG